MKTRSIAYFFREGIKGIIDNTVMSLASIAVISSCILIIVLSYCIAVNLDFNMRRFENTVGITAYPNVDLVASQITDLYNQIKDMQHIIEVEYVSPAQALTEFREKLGESGYILDGLEDDNPLKPSFRIRVDEAAYQKEVVNNLEDMSVIRKVSHALEETELLMSIGNAIRIFSLVLIGILSIIAIAIVMNSIKLAVSIRQMEIGIMKLVGSTDWFIRFPFIVEGMLIGMIGALIPTALCWLGYNQVVGYLSLRFQSLANIIQFMTSGQIFPSLFPLTLLIGVSIGVLGSLTSIRRYLKV